MRIIAFVSVLLTISGFANTSPLTSLYSSLDPTSVSQHFAFYELYPKAPEGRLALLHAWELLSGGCADCDPEMILPNLDVGAMISLVNRNPIKSAPVLQDHELKVIEKLSAHLGNRKIKGFGKWDMQEILKVPADEIDLARTLLLAEMGDGEKLKIRSYEASLDLMALQILARLKPNATPLEKIRAMNDYIFAEMRFRFPPHSLYAKDIDVYTFLPTVIDSRRGVCLGVSILFLSLAQRLELTLETVTPPGHIFVRYKNPQGEIINIETTARGVDYPSEMYLGIETKNLQMRNLREVVGLAFMNQAAVSWHRGDPGEAVHLYEKAEPFLGDDYLLNMFLGYNYLFIGKEKEGTALLQRIKNVVPDHGIMADSLSEDFLNGFVDADGIQAIFAEVDEKRSSILEKQKTLKDIVAKYPHFRQGFFHIAITWLQLGREKEALPILEHYHELNKQDPTASYYLSAIHFQRHNFNQSWKYLKAAETVVHGKDHRPHALRELRRELARVCPDSN